MAVMMGLSSPVAPMDDPKHEGAALDIFDPGAVGLTSSAFANPAGLQGNLAVQLGGQGAVYELR